MLFTHDALCAPNLISGYILKRYSQQIMAWALNYLSPVLIVIFYNKMPRVFCNFS